MRDINELTNKIINFMEERNWKQFHNPKDVALSLSLEASELLENFQWKTNEEALEKNAANIQDELADVIIYSLLFAHYTGIDVGKAVEQKLEKNAKKYPVEKSFNRKDKYTEL